MAKGTRTKQVQVEVPEVFNEHLVAFLHNNPHVTKVWINEQGEYHLGPVAGFTEYDVQDILNKVPGIPTPTTPATEDPNKDDTGEPGTTATGGNGEGEQQ